MSALHLSHRFTAGDVETRTAAKLLACMSAVAIELVISDHAVLREERCHCILRRRSTAAAAAAAAAAI